MSLRKIKSFHITDSSQDLFPFHLTNVNSPFVFNAGGFIEGIATSKGYMRYNGGGLADRASWISLFTGIWWDHYFNLTLRCVQ